MRYFMICCMVLFGMTRTVPGNAEAPPKEMEVDLGGGVTLELVLIPAGAFLMGDENGYPLERPVHKVTITEPFYLGKYEVTQQQWLAVMGGGPGDPNRDRHPMAAITWDDCQTFLARINARIGAQGGHFVLPTEAQWEYACRAGSTARYCFGDEEVQLADHAWYGANAAGQMHPVGEKKPNAWGLHDMHGNVCEWCADWYDPGYYAKSPTEDPRGPATGVDHAIRGSSWDRAAWVCRAAFRSYGPPGNWPFQGFRVSRVVPK